MSYKQLKIEDFLNKLSSTESMPGGGVAAALVAANGASCALKVCNLSLGKEKYKMYEGLIKESIVELEKMRANFLSFMDEDAKKFKAMEAVYKMPRDTEEEKRKRKNALETACKICCEIPASLLAEAAKAIVITSELQGKTNVSAESDLKVAIKFFAIAIKCAWDNIETNMRYIGNDEEFLIHLNKLKDVVAIAMKTARE